MTRFKKNTEKSSVNPSSYKKYEMDSTKLKACANVKINETHMMTFVSNMV